MSEDSYIQKILELIAKICDEHGMRMPTLFPTSKGWYGWSEDRKWCVEVIFNSNDAFYTFLDAYGIDTNEVEKLEGGEIGDDEIEYHRCATTFYIGKDDDGSFAISVYGSSASRAVQDMFSVISCAGFGIPVVDKGGVKYG